MCPRGQRRRSVNALPADGPLAGRVALVTGGSRGIGAGIAAAIADAGAEVAVNFRSQAAAAAEVARAARNGASTWRADVRDPDAAARLVAAVHERHGRLDILVANAGVWRGGRVEEITIRDWRLVLDTSLGGAFNVVRAAVPLLRESKGRIVAVSSVVALMGFPGDAAYAAAKAAIVGFVRSLAKELGPDEITVNAVAPGFISTAMTAAVSAGARERMLQRAALRRPGRVEDVASAVRFLVCDGDYITGQVLVVDGGLAL
jgi:3-oxoacyl-[acyl-carrier protein] reductase